jgi:hypothetical protein
MRKFPAPGGTTPINGLSCDDTNSSRHSWLAGLQGSQLRSFPKLSLSIPVLSDFATFRMGQIGAAQAFVWPKCIVHLLEMAPPRHQYLGTNVGWMREPPMRALALL